MLPVRSGFCGRIWSFANPCRPFDERRRLRCLVTTAASNALPTSTETPSPPLAKRETAGRARDASLRQGFGLRALCEGRDDAQDHSRVQVLKSRRFGSRGQQACATSQFTNRVSRQDKRCRMVQRFAALQSPDSTTYVHNARVPLHPDSNGRIGLVIMRLLITDQALEA